MRDLTGTAVPFADVDLVIRPERLDFGPGAAERIAARWAEKAAENPHIWNGPFFLFDRVGLDREAAGGTVFRAEGGETDFASFLAWREASPPPDPFRHLFPVGAVVSADDRLMVGRMGPRTANPGRLYPPSGSFDPDDLVKGSDGLSRLDPEANILREIGEETGLDGRRFAPEPGWIAIGSGPSRFALVKVYRAVETAAALEAEIADHMARDADPELDGVLFAPVGRPLDPVLSVPYVNVLLAELAARG
ncbi:NUDIX hydrolase [Prosthecomicrobium sp. N25]|uniref:NUDIX hydrolase n=1 Tax=Prosthecomicrobium sp. N25 TaxID=3129254 RepID=UPI00307785AF